VYRRPLQVSFAQIEKILDAGLLRPPAAQLEHPGRRVDPDDADSGLRGRDGDATRPDTELDYRSTGLARLRDVEIDVLRDAATPRVVQRRYRIVRAHRGR
jgi:hypothetical protein